jgi:hypothetical protein
MLIRLKQGEYKEVFFAAKVPIYGWESLIMSHHLVPFGSCHRESEQALAVQ